MSNSFIDKKTTEPVLTQAQYDALENKQSGTIYHIKGEIPDIPTPTSSDNGKFLGVSNGAYALSQLPSAFTLVASGTATNNGANIYEATLQITSGDIFLVKFVADNLRACATLGSITYTGTEFYLNFGLVECNPSIYPAYDSEELGFVFSNSNGSWLNIGQTLTYSLYKLNL